jgi:hypothetical protein
VGWDSNVQVRFIWTILLLKKIRLTGCANSGTVPVCLIIPLNEIRSRWNLFKKELELEFKSMYTYLFEKVLDLESRLIRTICFIISIKNTTTPYNISKSF